MTTTRTFPADPTSVAQARRFVARTLASLPEDVRGQIELMASELATNAVRHAGTQYTVTIERQRDAVRIAVTDSDAGEPEVQKPDIADLHGRGLLIVSSLASDWGVERLSDVRGKVVWFTVATLDRAAG